MKDLNHIDEKNNPTMVDVSKKEVSTRMAHAQSKILLPEVLWERLKDNEIQTKKGPIFHTAIIAGTMAVKKTHELIPFCHPLNIESCKIEISTRERSLLIDCKVKITGKTGVEMEALTGVTIAGLTVYDMCKALSHEVVIESTRLIEKTGGERMIKDGKYV